MSDHGPYSDFGVWAKGGGYGAHGTGDSIPAFLFMKTHLEDDLKS